MQHHRNALIGVVQQLSDGGAADNTRRDSFVEAIIQFLTFSSLTMNGLEDFQMSLQSLWTINMHVIE